MKRFAIVKQRRWSRIHRSRRSSHPFRSIVSAWYSHGSKKMLLDEYSILDRIDAVCEDIEQHEALMANRHSLTTENSVPLFKTHTFELDEQRRIANEEWQEVQEDRYRLFQRTIDPVWSVDVRFAGRASADSANAAAPPELGKSGKAAFNPRNPNRSAVAALLDANEAIKLISSITPATAKRLAEEIASDPTMNEDVRLSLAQRLVTQAKALADRPNAAAATAAQQQQQQQQLNATASQPSSLNVFNSTASIHNPISQASSTKGMMGMSSSEPVGVFSSSSSASNPAFPAAAALGSSSSSPARRRSAFNVSSSGSLFGLPPHEQPQGSKSLFPVKPTLEPDQMLLFAPDRTFDSATATSMKRVSGLVQVRLVFSLQLPFFSLLYDA